MTPRQTDSYLIRVETAVDGARTGTVTSVRTGEHAPFAGFDELARILDGWGGVGDASEQREEQR